MSFNTLQRMSTGASPSTGLQKRREQNRLAQQRFRRQCSLSAIDSRHPVLTSVSEKHRLRKTAGQFLAPPTPASTVSGGEQGPRPEDDTLTRFLYSSDPSSDWSLESSDTDVNICCSDSINDVRFSHLSKINESFLLPNNAEDAEHLDVSRAGLRCLWKGPLHITV